MQRLLTPWRTILRHPGMLALLGCSFLLGLATSFVIPFLSLFGKDEVRMSSVAFGVFMTVTSLSAIAVSTALARWSDVRWSRRSMLILGSVAGAIGYLAYAFVRDALWLTVIGCTVLAVSSVTFAQLFAHARESLARSKISASDVPLFMNMFRMFLALAWTVGPAAASWVMLHFSFRGTFLVAALLFLIFLLAVLRYVPAAPPWIASCADSEIPLFQTLLRPVVLAHFIGFVFVLAATTMSMMALPWLVTGTLGGNMHHVGVIYSVAPFFELPFMFYFGLLASRGDQSRLIRAAVLLAVIYYGLIAFVQEPWHIYPLQILSAAITAVIGGVAITFFQNFLPDHAGTATNLYASAGRAGSTAGYLIGGSVAQLYGNRMVFLVCMALSAASLVILWIFRPPPTALGASGSLSAN